MKLSLIAVIGALFMAQFAFASGGEPATLECSWGGKFFFDMPFKYGTDSPRTIDGQVQVFNRSGGDALGTINVTGTRFADGLSISGKSGKNSLSMHMSGNLPQRTGAASDSVYHGTAHINVAGLPEGANGNDIPVRCNFTKGQE